MSVKSFKLVMIKEKVNSTQIVDWLIFIVKLAKMHILLGQGELVDEM